MKIFHPKDLILSFGNFRVTSYAQLRDEIITPIQMLKNSSALGYFELYCGHRLERYKLECGLCRYTKSPDIMEQLDRELQSTFETQV